MQIVVIFEGCDGAGKGGAVQRIADSLNPRICRVVVSPAPTERWKKPALWPTCRPPAKLCCWTEAGIPALRGAPDGFPHGAEYWFSVSDEEQQRRFQDRLTEPARRRKLSPMDLESRGQ